MKSYINHLKTTSSFLQDINLKQKPVFRSSAIFPCICNKDLETNILFLGYWFIKKKIREVTVLITIRDKKGSIIYRKSLLVNEVKSYRICIKEILNTINFKLNFNGSIEIEVFSSKNLIFPYPAVVVNYFSKQSCSFVHSTSRTYNDVEDSVANNELIVPESGIDILPQKDFLPFISFVNGPLFESNKIIQFRIFNIEGKSFKKKIIIKNLKPFETKFLFFLKEREKFFLKGKKGKVKIYHNFKNFFPRFLSGNIKKDKKVSSLTHTYYDQSFQKKAYWKNPDVKNLYDSISTFPVFNKGLNYTELVLYPIYPKSRMKFDLEFYNVEGKCLKKINSIYLIKKKLDRPVYLNINKYLNYKEFSDEQLFAKLVIDGEGKLPTRLKFGLNLGKPKKYDIPSNICFSAAEPNNKILKKPGTFKWGLLVNKKKSSFILSNFSFSRNGFRKANVNIKFWRETDNSFISKKILINDNGSYFFYLNKNNKIKSFIGKGSSWVTFESDNPFLNGWYLEDMQNGIIGADHLF